MRAGSIRDMIIDSELLHSLQEEGRGYTIVEYKRYRKHQLLIHVRPDEGGPVERFIVTVSRIGELK